MRFENVLRVGVWLLLPAIWSINASAQTSVNEKRAAAADGAIAIDIPSGTLDIKGWANQELQVMGTVTPPEAKVLISGDARNLQITLTPQQNTLVSAHLEIHVPAGCTLRVKGVKTGIHASGVTGTVAAESAEGDIVVSDTATVELQTVTGKIELSGSGQRASVHAVNGSISVKSGTGDISASSVGGPIVVSGDKFSHVRLSTVTGSAEFDGKLGATASLSAESVSGTVKVVLPSGTGADVALSTMSGKIEGQLDNADKLERSLGPKQRVAFSIGGGGAKVAVQTLSGAIVLVKR